MILGCKMWDFLIIDAHELLRQKVGIFSVSALSHGSQRIPFALPWPSEIPLEWSLICAWVTCANVS